MCVPSLLGQTPIPNGVISTFLAPSTPVSTGQVVTVTIRMASYSGGIEIDSFNFIVNYNSNLLAFVPNSFNLGDSSGANKQWLSKPNQENTNSGYLLISANNTVLPGTLFICLGDVGIHNPEHGTLASSGFLVSFQLAALSSGTAAITLTPDLTGSVLLDTDLRPTGIAQLNGATVQVRDSAVLPSVTLVSPAEGTIFNAPAKIAMSASASSTNGTIAKVEFFTESTNKLGEITTALYSLDWTNPPAGPHTLTAVATDSYAATAASNPVHITVNAVGNVAITNPVNNATFTAPATIAIQATASDPDGTVARVEFYSGASLLGTDTNAPFAFTWSNVGTGSYVLTAKSVDDRGATNVSAPVNITVRSNSGPVHIVTAGSLLDSESGPVTGGIDAGERLRGDSTAG